MTLAGFSNWAKAAASTSFLMGDFAFTGIGAQLTYSPLSFRKPRPPLSPGSMPQIIISVLDRGLCRRGSRVRVPSAPPARPGLLPLCLNKSVLYAVLEQVSRQRQPNHSHTCLERHKTSMLSPAAHSGPAPPRSLCEPLRFV